MTPRLVDSSTEFTSLERIQLPDVSDLELVAKIKEMILSCTDEVGEVVLKKRKPTYSEKKDIRAVEEIIQGELSVSQIMKVCKIGYQKVKRLEEEIETGILHLGRKTPLYHPEQIRQKII